MKRTRKTIISQILLIAGVIVLINILADLYFVRLDFTADNRYTLSKATKNILKDLDDPVTVTAYFTDDLPSQLVKTKRDFKELLIEFANVSKGKVVYEFIDPAKDETTEAKAMQQGIQPVLINAREKDQIKQQKAYMGAVVKMGEETDVIPFMQQGSAMEYALSSSIKKLSVSEKPVIGLLQGHGEPSLRAISQVMEQLFILYHVEPVTLNDSVDLLGKYKTVAIVSPTDTIPPSQLAQLDHYLAQGGNLFIAMNRVEGDLNTLYGTSINTGLEEWLAQKGLRVEDNFVVDAQCQTIGVRQQQGMFSFTTPVMFPYIPVISDFAEHPVTTGLESVILPFASSITFSGDTSSSFIPLAFTSDKSGTRSTPLYLDFRQNWGEADFPLAALPVAAVLSGRLSGNAVSRILLISDGDFAVNGEGSQPQQIQEDNVNLMVNSIDYLSDDTGLIELRTKGITSRPLDQIEEGKKTLLKYVNFLLPIILIVVYGVLRVQRNRNLRVKRMEEGYV
jgi:gliding-associated putative ABC transporter substrate-binding component GldG